MTDDRDPTPTRPGAFRALSPLDNPDPPGQVAACADQACGHSDCDRLRDREARASRDGGGTLPPEREPSLHGSPAEDAETAPADRGSELAAGSREAWIRSAESHRFPPVYGCECPACKEALARPFPSPPALPGPVDRGELPIGGHLTEAQANFEEGIRGLDAKLAGSRFPGPEALMDRSAAMAVHRALVDFNLAAKLAASRGLLVLLDSDDCKLSDGPDVTPYPELTATVSRRVKV